MTTSSIFKSIGIRVSFDQVVRMGKKRLQELEEMNMALRMEKIELRRILEMDEEEKRQMCLQLQHVLEEQVDESSTPMATKDTSKMKPICGHGSNNGYGPY